MNVTFSSLNRPTFGLNGPNRSNGRSARALPLTALLSAALLGTTGCDVGKPASKPAGLARPVVPGKPVYQGLLTHQCISPDNGDISIMDGRLKLEAQPDGSSSVLIQNGHKTYKLDFSLMRPASARRSGQDIFTTERIEPEFSELQQAAEKGFKCDVTGLILDWQKDKDYESREQQDAVETIRVIKMNTWPYYPSSGND